MNIILHLTLITLTCSFLGTIKSQDDSQKAPALSDAQKASQEYLNKLFTSIDARKEQTSSQTEALLRVPKIRNSLLSMDNVNKYAEIIEPVLQQGNALAHNYYEFFHAQHWMWQLFQDTFTKLYTATQHTTNNPDFYFLRYTMHDPYYNFYDSNASFFLDYQLKTYGMVDDMTAVSGHLLSTNLALFSNLDYEGESTWEYFITAKSWIEPNRALMVDIMNTFSLPTTFVDRILELAPLLQTPEGRLFHILVPKTQADTFAYMAWTRGIPYDELLIKDIVKRRAEYPRPKIKEVVETYQKGFKAHEPFALEMSNRLRANAQAGAYYPSKYLDIYQKNPAQIPYFDTMQARLLITNNGLLNPTSGIKIVRYSTLAPTKQKEYDEALDTIIKSLVNSKK